LFDHKITKITDFHKIQWKGGMWAMEETIRFCWLVQIMLYYG